LDKSVHDEDTSWDVDAIKFVADSRLASMQDNFTVDYQRSWLGGEDFSVSRERGGGNNCGSCSCS
jgi:Fe-S cluster assembly iron-binding protein IscA